MLNITKVFNEKATIEINSPDAYGVSFRTTPNNEDAAIFTLLELLALTDFLQQIRPLIVDELEQYHKI